MKLKTLALLTLSHLLTGAVGVALGIYMLPILIAPPAPQASEITALSPQALYTAEFTKDLQDSDAFHWGEGKVFIGRDVVSFIGELAPGPDYKLYLSPEFVETEAAFEQLKPQMKQVGEIKTFENFMVALPSGTDPAQYNAVIVWCETFGEFITAAAYQ
ncbi:MAG: DM13 domain-containing protein [Oleiphilaceae bacterium]|nr:DM13 domain-containing protein [Oleiphilaceae bacterium]